MALAVALAVVTPTAFSPPSSAAAVAGSDFNPELIISDAEFYNGSAMTAAQIQVFLDGKIGSCQTTQCLNVIQITYPGALASYASNGGLLCNALQAGTMLFSEFLYRVQVACGISAKVVLATLQKEQSLVTSTAPNDWQLKAAMGMACPDTAACDTAFVGLATQVYSGTRQLKTYKVAVFAKQPGYQYIQYSPNAACGGTYLTVRNYATAALYSYTPYQPNAAALANLYGIGDGCSAYGNRNFWRFYNDWFGSSGSYMTSTVDVDYLVARDANNELWAYPTKPGGGWGSRTSLGTGWDDAKDVIGVGDLDGNGYRDIVVRDTQGRAWFYPGTGALEYPTRKLINVDWSAAKYVLYGGYFNAGTDADILTIDVSGDLWLWPGDGTGQFGTAVKVGSGFGSYTFVAGVGDFTGDGCGDLLGLAPSGDLMLYRGNCIGGFLPPTRIGIGFDGFTNLSTLGDFTGDGIADLWAKKASGSMYLFRGVGGGAIGNTTIVDQGWNVMQNIVGAGMRPAHPPTVTSVTTTGDMFAGYLIVRDRNNALWAYPANAAGDWSSRVSLGVGWAGANDIIGVGDLDGNGFRDVIARDEAGKAWFYPGDGRLDYPVRRAISADWSSARFILYGGYFDADGFPDMLTIDDVGDLWLWPGNGAGQFGARVKVAGGFSDSVAVAGVGDFDGDRCGDLVSITAGGLLLLHKSDCAGGVRAPIQIGAGFTGYTGIYSLGDFTADGIPDLWVKNGDLIRLFRGTGGGSVSWTSTTDHGWDSLLNITGAGMRPGAPAPTPAPSPTPTPTPSPSPTPTPSPTPSPTPTPTPTHSNSAGAGDLDGDGYRDVLGVTQGGALRLFRGDGSGGFYATTPILDSSWGITSRTVTLDDFNGDGHADLGRITADGVFELYAGDGAGGFGAAQRIGVGWSGFDRVFGMDFDGDGYQDVVARDAAGNLWLYRGNGAGGWLTGQGIKIGIGWGGFTEIFSAGNFDGVGGEDIIARASDGKLWLYPTNGSGIWRPRTLVGIGWGGILSIFSPGDFDGEGGPDVFARYPDGRLYLYRGNGTGTWQGSRLVDSGWNAMSTIG